MASKYQGVILAAGHGSRMGPFGEQVPKPIAPICNKPLMAYQLDHMRALGIEDVIIVIGHLGHRITQVLGDGSAYGVRIRYVEQERRLGLAHAVGQLERHLKHPFLLILGDIFYEAPNLAAMKNFSVIMREDGDVKRVIEKPRHPPNMLKGCGLYLFDLPIFDAIRRTPRTAMRDEYELTDSIQILIDYEYRVRIAPVVEWDMNLTFIGDLIACCQRQLKKLGESHVVGKGCEIAPGAALSETCIGDNVRITRPVRLERCVVLPGVTLDDGRDYTDTVITPDAKLYASQ